MRRFLIRDRDAGSHVEAFFVSAVAAVLGIRFWLQVTGYPRIEGHGLHIAHMLWGGLLMLAAILVLLSYLDRASVRQAAVLGGLGFGTFLDEVGKFVTQDNDYFYRPAVAIMYVVLVGAFLATRWARGRRRFSREEWLVNALRETENVALHDLDPDERRRALAFLDRSDPANPLVTALRQALRAAPLVPEPRPGPAALLARRAREAYRRLVGHAWFTRGLVVFFVGQLVVKLAYVAGLFVYLRAESSRSTVLAVLERLFRHPERPTFAEWAELGASLLSGVFVLLGVVALRRSRLAALRMFHRSILVTLLLTQVFMFYLEQLSALTGFALNVLILLALGYMIEREREHRAAGNPA